MTVEASRVETTTASAQTDSAERTLLSDTKTLLSLGLPYAAANLLLVGSEQASSYILSRASNSDLAASNLAAFTIPISLIFNASLTGLSPIISELDIRGDRGTIVQMIQQGWVFGSLLCIPQAIIYGMSKPLLRALGQPDHLIDLAEPYFDISIIALPALAYLAANTRYVYGKRQTLPIIGFNAFDLVVGTALNAALVLGTPLTPPLGFKGYAIATVSQAWLNCFLSMGYLRYVGKRDGYSFFKPNFNNFKPLAKRFLKLGGFLTAKMLILSTSIFYRQSMIGTRDEGAILAVQVAVSYTNFAWFVNDSIAQAVSTLTARATGERNLRAIKNYYKAGLGCAFGTSLVFSIPAFVAPQHIGRFFIKDSSNQDMELISNLLCINAFLLLFESINQVLAGAFLGRENAKVPAITSFLTFLLVTLPVTFALYFETKLETLDICLGYLAGSIAQAFVISGMWSSELRKMSREEMADEVGVAGDHKAEEDDGSAPIALPVARQITMGEEETDSFATYDELSSDSPYEIDRYPNMEEDAMAFQAGYVPHPRSPLVSMNFVTREYKAKRGETSHLKESIEIARLTEGYAPPSV